MLEYIELSGVKTAFEVAGSGPALLMLHGAEGSRRQFSTILPSLTSRYTVITYDQRDCGDTASPHSPATLTTLADDAQALLQALGHPAAFVFGASFGGRIAQALAVRHSQMVRRLVLASTWPLPVSLDSINPDIAQDISRIRLDLPASAEQLAEIFFPAEFLHAHPAYREHFKAAAPRSARSERRATAVGDVPDLDIATIDQPTLLIAGTLDRVVPPELTLSLAKYIRDTKSVLLDGVGHLTLAQAPTLVARHLLAFLA